MRYDSDDREVLINRLAHKQALGITRAKIRKISEVVQAALLKGDKTVELFDYQKRDIQEAIGILNLMTGQLELEFKMLEAQESMFTSIMNNAPGQRPPLDRKWLPRTIRILRRWRPSYRRTTVRGTSSCRLAPIPPSHGSLLWHPSVYVVPRVPRSVYSPRPARPVLGLCLWLGLWWGELCSWPVRLAPPSRKKFSLASRLAHQLARMEQLTSLVVAALQIFRLCLWS